MSELHIWLYMRDYEHSHPTHRYSLPLPFSCYSNDQFFQNLCGLNCFLWNMGYIFWADLQRFFFSNEYQLLQV